MKLIEFTYKSPKDILIKKGISKEVIEQMDIRENYSNIYEEIKKVDMTTLLLLRLPVKQPSKMIQVIKNQRGRKGLRDISIRELRKGLYLIYKTK